MTEQRVNTSSAEYRRYDQVAKQHTYRLAENPSDEFDEDYQIDCLDFSRFLSGTAEEQAIFARDLGKALGEIGFAILTRHGVDAGFYRALETDVRRVFEDTSLATKLQFRAARHGSVSQGYFPIRETSDIHPDLVEGWVWCRRAFDLPQVRSAPFDPADYWPTAGLEPRFRELVNVHEPLFKPIAQAILQGLGVDRHLLDDRLVETNFGLRLNYYPPLDDAALQSRAGRLLGHEDVDLFTLLPASSVDGLQVWNHVSGKWIRLSAPEGSLIINTGDYLQRLSNDRLPSTTHRVGQPRNAADLGRPRVSMPMAVYLWEDELLEVLPGLGTPRYEPIRAITFHTRSTAKFYGDDYAVD